jgi:hypothetical protein
MRYIIISFLLLLPACTKGKLEDKIKIKFEAIEQSIPVDLTLKFPPKTTSQIIRVFTAVTGLIMLCYGVLWSKEVTERTVQAAMGFMLIAFTMTHDPADAMPTLSTEGTNELT